MGQRPIPDELVAEVRAARGTGSHRVLAARFGISTCSISKILSGKHRTISNRDIDLGTGETRLEQPRRCGECGLKVDVWPCRACRAQEALRRALSQLALAGPCPHCHAADQVLHLEGRLCCAGCGRLRKQLSRHLRRKLAETSNVHYERLGGRGEVLSEE